MLTYQWCQAHQSMDLPKEMHSTVEYTVYVMQFYQNECNSDTINNANLTRVCTSLYVTGVWKRSLFDKFTKIKFSSHSSAPRIAEHIVT